MPLNPYFQTGAGIGSVGEQNLYNDLLVESIQIHGMSVQYCPRTFVSLDKVYMEDTRAAFTSASEIEMYLKSWDGFQGDGSFFSNMGVEIRDAVTFTVVISRFLQVMGGAPYSLIRPREGDLIYYPFNNKLFEIKYVEKFSMHYPLGKLYTYDLKCELFEYSGQTIQTGIAGIDSVVPSYNQDLLYWGITDEAGNYLVTEGGDYLVQDQRDTRTLDPLDDTDQIQAEANSVIDWSEYDVFTESKY